MTDVRASVRIEGMDEVMANLQKYVDGIDRAVPRALWREAEEVMGASKEGFVPVDTGRLRSTGYVAEPVVTGSNVSVELGYDTEYAIYVHENLTAMHPVGQAKYLEEPMTQRQPQMADNIARYIAEEAGLL